MVFEKNIFLKKNARGRSENAGPSSIGHQNTDDNPYYKGLITDVFSEIFGNYRSKMTFISEMTLITDAFIKFLPLL
jgi:hypothetical protein